MSITLWRFGSDAGSVPTKTPPRSWTGSSAWPCWWNLPPLGKRRSRDVKDDPFLACALASRAEFIVTKDKDLLVLEKPFGVEIVTPREFYRRLEL